jgi:hypothetical protein
MKVFPVVRRVGVSQSKLWKSGAIFKDGINFGVECDGPTAGLGKGPVGTISVLLSSPLSAHLRELMSGPRTGFGVTLGKYPDDSRPQIVYERVDAG